MAEVHFQTKVFLRLLISDVLLQALQDDFVQQDLILLVYLFVRSCYFSFINDCVTAGCALKHIVINLRHYIISVSTVKMLLNLEFRMSKTYINVISHIFSLRLYGPLYICNIIYCALLFWQISPGLSIHCICFTHLLCQRTIWQLCPISFC